MANLTNYGKKTVKRKNIIKYATWKWNIP